MLLNAAPLLAMLVLQQTPTFRKEFAVMVDQFTSAGRSDYFVLEPDYQLTLEGEKDGQKSSLVVTVLPETARIDGILCRIVEERTLEGEVITGLTRRFLAMDRKTRDIYCFGKDVTGAKGWKSGSRNAHYALWLAGHPAKGDAYYRELSPDVAMTRLEHLAVAESVATPAGTFDRCVTAKETDALFPEDTRTMAFAPSIGLVQFGDLKLVNYTGKK